MSDVDGTWLAQELHDTRQEGERLQSQLVELERHKQEARVLLDHIRGYVDSCEPGQTWGQDKCRWLTESHARLQMQLDSLEGEYNDLMQRHKMVLRGEGELQSQLGRYRAALEWYAISNNWHRAREALADEAGLEE